DRTIRALRWRAARDGARRRGRTETSRRARRRLGRARELLRGARGRRRIPALHATAVVSGVGRPRRAALRRPRPDRRLEARAEPAPERPVPEPPARSGRSWPPAGPPADEHGLLRQEPAGSREPWPSRPPWDPPDPPPAAPGGGRRPEESSGL